MPKYDRQLVLAFLSSDPHDENILSQATALNQKQHDDPLPTELVMLKQSSALEEDDLADLKRALGGQRSVSHPITSASRLYLVGEGDWQHRTLSTLSPDDVADIFGRLGMPPVKLISIVADSLGRPPAGSATPNALDSFAALFHRRLKEAWQIETSVNARTLSVTVASGSVSDPVGLATGQKFTTRNTEAPNDAPSFEHQRRLSKVTFSWVDGLQTVHPTY